MKARNASACMLALGVLVACLALRDGRPGLAFAQLLLSASAVLSLHGSRSLWKPWFMAGVDHDEPPATIFVVQAAAAEALMIVGVLSGTAGHWLIGLRFLAVMIQISTVGKLSNDTATENNEISRKSASRPDPRHPRKP